MNWSEWKSYLTQENILHFLEQYRDLGFLPGVLLPLLEAIIPVLPLFIIVAGNAAAYGFWLGALLSWLGAVLGSLVVFFLYGNSDKSDSFTLSRGIIRLRSCWVGWNAMDLELFFSSIVFRLPLLP